MTKVKFDGWCYYAINHEGVFIPFWSHKQGQASTELKGKIGVMHVNEEYEINDDRIYIQNCGPQCTGLWPDLSCGVCGGLGVGATFN